VEILCTHVENEKMRHVETIPGMGEEGRTMMEVMNSTMIYFKKFYKYHNVPPAQQ
jgi:hypothetical protein